MIPLAYNLRSLTVRRATTLATILGIALVVFVLAAALMLASGIRKTLGRSGRNDRAIVLRKGSDSELSSSIETPAVSLIRAAPGVRPDKSGAGIGVGELVVVITLDKIGVQGVSNVQVRGVPEDAMGFRPEMHLIAGRAARRGSDEVIIGQRLRGRFRGLDLEKSFELRKGRQVQVVGVFADGGSAFESETWADLDTLRSAFGREGLVSAVRVQLLSPEKFDAFKTVIEQDKQLGLDALREDVFYEKQSEGTSLFVRALGILIALTFSLGAMIGAMITMYASIASRQREIGTLRALGFSRLSILSSFLLEALMLALCGGALGTLLSLLLQFVKFSMINFASFSEIVFSFTPTPPILIFSVLFGGLMGLCGGFFPAVRAARVSPVRAMRG